MAAIPSAVGEMLDSCQRPRYSRAGCILWPEYGHRTPPMSRSENLLRSEDIKSSLNAETIRYLDKLIDTGLFGNTRADAIKIMINRTALEMMDKGLITPLIPLPKMVK
jgi:hypothetical protein